MTVTGRTPGAPDLERLLQIPDLKDFIAESYRKILLREPDGPGARQQARRLRLNPFYSRRQFLINLLASEEYRRLQEQEREGYWELLNCQRRLIVQHSL